MPSSASEEQSPLLGPGMPSSASEEQSPLLGPGNLAATQPRDQPGLPHDPVTHHETAGQEIEVQSPPNQRRRCLGIVCLMLVIFLQCFGSDYDEQVKSMANKVFDMNKKEVRRNLMTVVAVAALVLYFLPLVIGLYVDTYAGRYKTLFFGLCLKLTGNFLGFVANLVFESVKEKSTYMVSFLFAVFAVSLVTLLGGAACVFISLVTFSSQQVQQTFYGISSVIRWFSLCVIAGLASSHLSLAIRNLTPSWLDTSYPFYGTVLYALMLGCDALSVVIFLLGKAHYKMQTLEKGRKSWENLVRIVKAFVFRTKSPYVDDSDILRSAESLEAERRYRRTLDRLILRKAVLFFGLVSCMAVSFSLTYFMRQIVTMYKHTPMGYYWAKLVRNIQIPYLFGPAVVGIIFKKFGGTLKPESNANQLKTIGVASLLGAIALVIAGMVSKVKDIPNSETVSVFWLVPQFLVMDVASFLLDTSALTLCYLTSPKGLETFTFCVCVCLSVLIIAIEAIVNVSADLKKFSRVDIICFSLAGIMVFVLLAIYIPLSRWFLKAGRDIDDVIEAEATGETPVTRNESLTGRDDVSRGRGSVQYRDLPTDPEAQE